MIEKTCTKMNLTLENEEKYVEPRTKGALAPFVARGISERCGSQVHLLVQ